MTTEICPHCSYQKLTEVSVYLYCSNCNAMFIDSDSLHDTVDALLDKYDMDRSKEAQRLGEQVASLQD